MNGNSRVLNYKLSAITTDIIKVHYLFYVFGAPVLIWLNVLKNAKHNIPCACELMIGKVKIVIPWRVNALRRSAC